MENQRKDEEEDRISELPEPILHHVLCYLSQKEAVQTGVLSKSWRHLGPTRPKIEFGEEFFNGNEEEKYLSAFLEKTLQRYRDQNLSIQEFIISGIKEGSESSELLEKWVPIVLLNMGVNIFDLSGPESCFFKLPPELLKAEFLTELCLGNCKINSLVDDDRKVLCKHLRKLHLYKVHIRDASFEKIISSCPLIEDLDLDTCEGLQTMKLTRAPNLKIFKFRRYVFPTRGGECRTIEIIDAPNIEIIKIIGRWPSWIHNPNMYFPRLKTLRLWRVRLSYESIDLFSTNLPCLEKLTLSGCFFDFEQFKLSSRSIKHLIIELEDSSVKAVIIDATNILYFEFYPYKFLPSISFSTTSAEWKSKIRVVVFPLDFEKGASSWFLRLSEIVKALSASQISLLIHDVPQVVPDNCSGDVYQPLVIENLSLVVYDQDPPVSDFLNYLFRSFRPRNIQQTWYADHHPLMSRVEGEREHNLIELLCKFLLSNRHERSQYFGQQNLEDVRMEASYENEEEWRGVVGTSSLSEFALPWDSLKILFRLKWRIE